MKKLSNKGFLTLLFLLICVLGFSSSSFAIIDSTTYFNGGIIGTSISWGLGGIINADTIDVRGDIMINNGATLTILPGTVIRFTDTDVGGNFGLSGKCELIVGTTVSTTGKLIAVGETNKKIIFTAKTTPTAGDWRAIVFNKMADNTSEIKYAEIKYSRLGILIDALDVSPTIHYCTFLASDTTAFYLKGGAKPTILNNTITIDNATATEYGIYCTGSGTNPSIKYNTISSPNTNDRMIYADNSAKPDIIKNNFYYTGTVAASSNYAVYLSSAGNVKIDSCYIYKGDYGIYSSATSPVITNNTIETVSAVSNTKGAIYCATSGTATISNNTIKCDVANSYGINIATSVSATIQNNTIRSINGAGYGIYYLGSSSGTIDNNIIKGNSGTGISVGSTSVTTSPVISNNKIDSLGTGILCTSPTTGGTNPTISGCRITTVNSLATIKGISLSNSSPIIESDTIDFSGVSTSFNSAQNGIECGPSGTGAGSSPKIQNTSITISAGLGNRYGISIAGNNSNPDIGGGSQSSIGRNKFNILNFALNTDLDRIIYNQTSNSIYAKNNYWGQSPSNDTTGVLSRVYSSLTGTSKDGMVLQNPWYNSTFDTSYNYGSYTTSGTLTGNETWSGTVYISGDISIPNGVTLTINPGTKVVFAYRTSNRDDDTYGTSYNPYYSASRCDIIVEAGGILKVKGTAGSMVTFTAKGASAVDDWGYIRILSDASTAQDTISYATIQYSRSGVYMSGTPITATIRNCIFNNNDSGGSASAPTGAPIYCAAGASPYILNNTINVTNNATATNFAIACTSTTNPTNPTIQGNVINLPNNNDYGIVCAGSAVSAIINGNKITRSTLTSTYGIFCSASATPSITYNTILGPGTGTPTATNAGIRCDNATPSIIRKNVIVGGNRGIDFNVTSTNPIVRANTIRDSSGFRMYGIVCHNSSPAVDTNIVNIGWTTRNQKPSADITWGVSTDPALGVLIIESAGGTSQPTFSYNKFMGNALAIFNNTDGKVINAENNYWDQDKVNGRMNDTVAVAARVFSWNQGSGSTDDDGSIDQSPWRNFGLGTSYNWGTHTNNGVIESNEVWSGNVFVSGDITIAISGTLVIMPGTIVTFPDSTENRRDDKETTSWIYEVCDIFLDSGGSLIINGTSTNMVYLSPRNANKNVDDWGHIRTRTGADTLIIKYADIGYTRGGIYYSGPVTYSLIENSHLHNNRSVAIWCPGTKATGGASPNIIGNIIDLRNNADKTGVTGAPLAPSFTSPKSTDFGIYCYGLGANPLIQGNTINGVSDNDVGIYFGGTQEWDNQSMPTIKDNIINMSSSGTYPTYIWGIYGLGHTNNSGVNENTKPIILNNQINTNCQGGIGIYYEDFGEPLIKGNTITVSGSSSVGKLGYGIYTLNNSTAGGIGVHKPYLYNNTIQVNGIYTIAIYDSASSTSVSTVSLYQNNIVISVSNTRGIYLASIVKPDSVVGNSIGFINTALTNVSGIRVNSTVTGGLTVGPDNTINFNLSGTGNRVRGIDIYNVSPTIIGNTITFNPGLKDTVNYTVVGIYCDGITSEKKPVISDCNITNGDVGIMCTGYSSPKVSGTTITNSVRNVWINSNNSNPDLGGGLQSSIGRNKFIGGLYAILNNKDITGTIPDTIFAKYNYWGSSDSTVVGTRTYSNATAVANDNDGVVRYHPWYADEGFTDSHNISYTESGVIKWNETWTTAMSPIVIRGDLTVASTYTLTVDPGVVIKIAKVSNRDDDTPNWGGFGKARTTDFIIRGKLRVNGQSGQMVTITSNSTIPADSDWYYIKIIPATTSDSSSINYANIKYGYYGIYATGQYANANIRINNCTFSNNKLSAIYCVGSTNGISPQILNNTINISSGNYLSYGIFAKDANTKPLIQGNIFNSVSKRDEAIHFDTNAAPTIKNNRMTFLYGKTDTTSANATFGIYGSSPTAGVLLSGNRITGATFGIYYQTPSGTVSPTIDSTVVSDNYHGIYIKTNVNPKISYSTLSYNYNGFIYDGNPVVGTFALGGSGKTCNIYGNQFGATVVRNTSADTSIEARYNYWGNSGGPNHDLSNVGGPGDRADRKYKVKPWATSMSGNNPPAVPTLVSPTDMEIIYLNPPTLEVANQGGSIQYLFEVDTSSTFGSPAKKGSGLLTTNTWTTPKLISWVTYYWRAKTYDPTTGLYSNWASSRRFEIQINTKPPIPTLASPVGGAIVNTLTPILTVNAVSDSDGPQGPFYRFQVDTDIGFSSPNLKTSEWSTSTSWTTPNLNNRTMHYWRSEAYDGVSATGTSGWSEIDSFYVDWNTLPPIPALVSPTGGVAIDTLIPTLVVRRVTDEQGDIVKYNFRIADNIDFANALFSGLRNAETDSAWYVGTTLKNRTNYYWSVKVYDALQSSGTIIDSTDWSPADSFYVDYNTPPNIPLFIYPINKVAVDTLMPTLKIRKAVDVQSDSVQYRFQIARNTNFTSAISSGIQPDTVWYVNTPLTNRTVYYWRIKVYDLWANGTLRDSTAWSNPDSVYIDWNTPPTMPVKVSPIHKQKVPDNKTVTLVINKSTDAQGDTILYRYRIKHLTQMDETVSSAVMDTSIVMNIPLPDDKTTWLWYVRAIDIVNGLPKDSTDWSPADTFVVEVVSVALANFTASSKGNLVQIQWETVKESNLLGYNLLRSTSEFGTYQRINSDLISGGKSTYQYIDRRVNAGTYYYRLESIETDGKATLLGTTKVDVKSILPMSFALGQNYPNPFNPTTTINYQIPVNNNVHTTLKVYSVSGQLIRTLVDMPQSAGYYTVKWDGRDEQGKEVSSGVYIYKITAGNFTDTKRMILMK